MTAPVVPILLGGLFAWSIYRRVRRNIGRQPLRPRRTMTSLVILSIFCALIIAISFQNINVLLAFSGGLALGTMFGFLGLRLTKFETTDEGHFYTPNAHIGVALSLLLVGRMAYRYWANGGFTPTPGQSPIQSPLTYFIIGLTFGYYIVFQTGLFIHSRDKK